MSKGEHRRFAAEQKLEILREAEQPGVTVSEVCRRHGLAVSVFYRWRAGGIEILHTSIGKFDKPWLLMKILKIAKA
jgi:hypothetical protein